MASLVKHSLALTASRPATGRPLGAPLAVVPPARVALSSEHCTTSPPGKQLALGRAAAAGAACHATKGFGTKAAPAVTCPCGSKVVYKECCGPLHMGKVPAAASAEALLRARFSAFAKEEEGFILATDKRPDTDREQLKRDVAYTISNYVYSSLKVTSSETAEGPSGSETTLTYSYNRKWAPAEQGGPVRGLLSSRLDRTTEKRTGSRNVREKAREPERNLDGSVKVTKVTARSKFRAVDGALSLVEETIDGEPTA